MMEQAIAPHPPGRRNLAGFGIALSVALAIPLAMIVEGLAFMMVENSATWRELAVLSLFAVPLVTGWVAIAISLAGRPSRLRLSVAVLLLLVPPVLLFAIWNA
jgi:hypothetical protein